MNNNDYREITEDDVTTVSTDQKEEMNGQESVNDTPDVSENEKETVQAEVTNSDASDEKEPEYVYYNGRMVHRSALEQESLFNDDNSVESDGEKK